MDVPEIDVVALADRQADGAPLVDVREGHELAVVSIPGAVHIPLGDLVERVDEVEELAGTGTVYVICERGSRSARAVAHIRSLGIDAVNVAGGTLAWVDAGLPTEAAGSGAGSA
jgi:rhodanese-related sulfurtransferase